jgi:GNAT superfamily N-acetyltransferase
VNLPAALTWRFGTPDDAGAILELVALAEEHHDGVAEVDASDVAMDLRRVGFDVTRDLVLVFDGETPVAWADVHRGRAEVDVRPSHLGRGIGTALLGWTEERARELGSETVVQPVTDHDAEARALFLANGYTTTGTSWILEIAFDGPPPAHPAPPGIEIRAYDPDRDAHPAHELIEEAFSEWDDRISNTFEEWAAFIRDHEAFAPAFSRLAFDDGRLVGTTLSFDYPDIDEGWIQQVATRATHRHRGIARALLSETFRAFYDSGKPRCGLSTDSRTGALALYERVGMHVRRSYTRFTKRLDG